MKGESVFPEPQSAGLHPVNPPAGGVSHASNSPETKSISDLGKYRQTDSGPAFDSVADSPSKATGSKGNPDGFSSEANGSVQEPLADPKLESFSGPDTSASLLIRIRDPNDDDSWQLFEQIYGPMVRGFCLRRGMDRDDVEDVGQMVMSKIFQSVHRFHYDPTKGRFRAWLGTITANTIRDFLRKQKNRVAQNIVANFDSFLEHPDGSDWSDHFIQCLFETACNRVRPNFDLATWRCFEGVWIERRNSAEVADQLGIQVHSVYVNKSRVLKRLEQEIKTLTDDVPLAESE